MSQADRTKNPRDLAPRERARIVLGLLYGELEYDEVCREYGLDRATLEAWEQTYLKAVSELDKPTPKPGRRARVAAAIAATFLVTGSGLFAYASTHCASGLICFSATEPATADDVNQNFKTLKDWLVQKVGPVDESRLTVGGGSPWGVHVGQRDGDGLYGLRFFRNAAGGSDDRAWVKYFRDGTGEDLALQIGIANNANDQIQFFQAGQERLNIGQGQVRVRNAPFTTSGNANIFGNLNVAGTSSFGGNVNFLGNVTVNGQPLVTMQRFTIPRSVSDKTLNTNISTADWNCVIGGIGFLDGDIQENNRGDIIKLWTYPSNGTWHFQADFRTHDGSQISDVGIVCFRKEISDLSSWWTSP
jgi:hypothetical protein